MTFELNAQNRTTQGTGASRRLRFASKVPAIIYGQGFTPINIEIDHNEFFLLLKKENFISSLINVKLDGKVHRALLRDIQMHAFKRQIMHADFLRVDDKQLIQQKIPLRFINADIAPGVKVSGGLVSHALNEITVSCLPQDLPAFITVDLKDLAAGKTLHVSQLPLPANVEVVLRKGEDAAVVSIVAKKRDKAADAEAAAAAEAAGTAAQTA